jgi:5-methylcytosine-specific restriction protein A
VSTIRRTPGIYASPAPRGPNGERLCRNCKGPMPKGARHNCSAKCSEEWQCKTSPSILRRVIERRDKGVCALCGIDTLALKREYTALRKELKVKAWEDYPANDVCRAFLSHQGIPPGRACSDWWDADHITPVVEGGGECGPEGYRTLCIPCHKDVTAELAARRAVERRRDKVVDRDDERGLLRGL